MNILPYKYLELKTSLTADEAKQAIDKSCKKQVFSFFSFFNKRDKTKLFGELDNDTFKLYRNIGYQNSFLPRAYGHIQTDGFASKVIIRISMSVSTVLFMLVWLSISFVSAMASIDKYQGLETLIPFAFFIFGYTLMSLAFWFEVPKLIHLIENIFADGSTKSLS
jgi:hypothetical protein